MPTETPMTPDEQRAKQCADNILSTIGSNRSEAVLREALALAYTSGRRDEVMDRISRLIKRDDDLARVTG